MAKLTKDELLSKITEKILDEDLSIELMEDISDSFGGEDNESVKAEYEAKISELTNALDELKKKYKERFLQGEEESEEKEESEESEELEEKEVIDVEEI